MGFDAGLVAAATLQRATGLDPTTCSASDATHQLQLAHVLLDGGYDGVATVEEAIAGGDHGLGTFDRLDGEMIVLDGDPWQVNWQGIASIMPPETRTPFVSVSTMHAPRTQRLQDVTWDQTALAIESLVDDPGAIITVRIEGEFDHALTRSVPPQDRPYRPYSEVCVTDEVRWTHDPFGGVMIGFRFPDLEPGSTIPGLHLHALNHERTTGGHVHELHIKDAVLSVGISRDVVMHLPERTMTDLLETPPAIRLIQRQLLRKGPRKIDQLAADLSISPEQAQDHIDWLFDRGFVTKIELPGSEPAWKPTLHTHATKEGGTMAAILDAL